MQRRKHPIWRVIFVERFPGRKRAFWNYFRESVIHDFNGGRAKASLANKLAVASSCRRDLVAEFQFFFRASAIMAA